MHNILEMSGESRREFLSLKDCGRPWEPTARTRERCHTGDSLRGRLFAGLLNMIRARKSSRVLHNFALYRPPSTDNEQVLAFSRQRHDGNLFLPASFQEHPQSVQDDLPERAVISGSARDLLAEHTPVITTKWPYPPAYLPDTLADQQDDT